MPYRKFTRVVKGQKKYCMENIKTNKTYCYKSKADRSKGMQMHEAFASGWKPTKLK